MPHWTKQFECEEILYREDDGIIIHGDSLNVLKTLPHSCVDMLLLDCPWGYTCTPVPRTWVGLQYKTLKDRDIFKAIILAEKRLKTNRHVHMWATSPRLLEQARIAMLITTFTELRYVSSYVWRKQSGLGMGHYFRIDCEYSLVFVKGRRLGCRHDIPNWISADLGKHSHKPVAALEAMIEMSTKPGEVILDPFLHDGQTAVVAKSMGRKFVGIEIDRSLAEAAVERVSQKILFTVGE